MLLNLSVAFFHLALNVYLFFLLPLFFLPMSPVWASTALAVAALSNPFWSVIHEAIHDLLHPVFRINERAGRLMGIFFGSPFRVLRTSHLLHHRLNRSPIEGTELYDFDKTSRLRANVGYYAQILCGLYLLEVVSPLLFVLPRRRIIRMKERRQKKDGLAGLWLGSLTASESISQIRRDGCLIFCLFALSGVCYGRYWPWLVGALVLRGFFISFLDNVYHYNTRTDDLFYADNLWLPASVSRILLHFNLHGVHHRNTTIPWIRLPDTFHAHALTYEGSYFAAAARQLRGPLSLSKFRTFAVPSPAPGAGDRPRLNRSSA